MDRPPRPDFSWLRLNPSELPLEELLRIDDASRTVDEQGAGDALAHPGMGREITPPPLRAIWGVVTGAYTFENEPSPAEPLPLYTFAQIYHGRNQWAVVEGGIEGIALEVNGSRGVAAGTAAVFWPSEDALIGAPLSANPAPAGAANQKWRFSYVNPYHITLPPPPQPSGSGDTGSGSDPCDFTIDGEGRLCVGPGVTLVIDGTTLITDVVNLGPLTPVLLLSSVCPVYEDVEIGGSGGVEGPPGPTGPAGADGSVWRDGSGAPSSGLGIDGDYYLDDATGDVYLKGAGAYAVVANIKGATGATGAAGSAGSAGAPGSVWRDGAGAPSSGLGIDGDYYLNDSNGDVYLKAAGAYSVVANIKGATGATGAAGAAGPNSVSGTTATTLTGVLRGDGASVGTVTIGANLSYVAGTLSAVNSGGTVTTVSVVTANGVSGTVANPTTTPAITLTLGNITPTSVAATGAVSATSTDGATTGVPDNLVVGHNTTGTAADGVGARVVMKAQTSTTPDSIAAMLEYSWATAAHATRKGRLKLQVVDAAAVRTVVTVSTDGAQGTLGFFGSGSVAQQSGDAGAALAAYNLMSGTPTFAGANVTGTVPLATSAAACTGNAATVTTNANLTGDVASVGNATTLAAAGTAGTYTKVTTDAKGRVTAGANLASTDLPQRHNLLANGGAWFFQRTAPGTLTAVANDACGPDRWNVLTQTASVQIDRTAGNAGRYAMRLKQNQAAAQRMGCEQILEASDSVAMRGRTVRLQFNAKCSATTTLRFAILEWTGTADAVTSNVVLSWTSGTFTAGNFFLASSLTVTATGSASVGTGFTSCTLSGTVSASCNNLIVFVWTDAAAAQNVTVELAEVVLCDADLPRDWLPDPLPAEFARCQRFYQKTFADGTAPAQGSATAGRVQFCTPVAGAVGVTFAWWEFPCAMRAAPTVTTYNPGAANVQVRNESRAADCSGTGSDNVTVSSVRVFTTQAGATAAGDTLTLHITADAEL